MHECLKTAFLAVACAIALSGCSETKDVSRFTEVGTAAAAVSNDSELESQVSLDAQAPTALAKFSIIDRTSNPPTKLSIDVRLPEKISEAELYVIATHLKASEPQTYERIFILYYLPDMVVGSGAWASTHFDPDLQVKILGLSREAEQKALEATGAIQNKLGVWLDDRPYVGSTYILYGEPGSIKLKATHRDGSGSTKDIIEKIDSRGRVFTDREGNEYGEYYLLSPDGNLSLFDREGFILQFKKSK